MPAPKQKLHKTGDVVKRTGLSRQVIYAYTTMGLIREAKRTRNGHRLYDDTVFVHLQLIQSMQAMGYNLREIKRIFFSRE